MTPTSSCRRRYIVRVVMRDVVARDARCVQPKGAYLVRCSSRPGCFVVSWVSNDDGLIIHTLVTPRASNDGYNLLLLMLRWSAEHVLRYDIEGDKRSYPSIPGIVTAYGKHLTKLIMRTGKLM
jgi:hypothetical protein